MRHDLKNIYNRVLLCPLERIHIEHLRILRNRERKWFIYSKEIEADEQQKWYDNYLKAENDYMFSIFLVQQPDIFIGAVALYNIDQKIKTCEFGRLLIDHDITSEKGLGYDATICACHIAFEQLKVEKIFLEVFKDNIRAIKTYQKAGFSAYDQNKDIIKMSITRNEFKIIYERGMVYVNSSIKTKISY